MQIAACVFGPHNYVLFIALFQKQKRQMNNENYFALSLCFQIAEKLTNRIGSDSFYLSREF